VQEGGRALRESAEKKSFVHGPKTCARRRSSGDIDFQSATKLRGKPLWRKRIAKRERGRPHERKKEGSLARKKRKGGNRFGLVHQQGEAGDCEEKKFKRHKTDKKKKKGGTCPVETIVRREEFASKRDTNHPCRKSRVEGGIGRVGDAKNTSRVEVGV